MRTAISAESVQDVRQRRWVTVHLCQTNLMRSRTTRCARTSPGASSSSERATRAIQRNWYCASGGGVVREEVFELDDTGSQVRAALVKFNEDEAARTCPTCGAVHLAPGLTTADNMRPPQQLTTDEE